MIMEDYQELEGQERVRSGENMVGIHYAHICKYHNEIIHYV